MWKTLPTLVFLLVIGGLAAQTTVTSNYLPAIGDSLKFSIADSASAAAIVIGDVGGPNDWDLTGLVAARTSSQTFVALEPGTQDDAFPGADAKVETGDLATNYYTIDDENGLVLIGNIGATAFIEDFVVTTPFVPGYVERRATVEFVDQNTMESNIRVTVATDSLPQEIIDATNGALDAADSVRFVTEIERSDLVDAYGTATLGNETFDVLREKRVEIRGVTVEAYNSFLGWQDVTALIILALPNLGELLENQDTVTTYTLWSDASIDPIAVIETETDGETVTGVTYKTVETTSSTDDDFGATPEISIFPNPARTLANFRATGLQNGTYELRILNITGRQVIHQKLNVVGSQLRTTIDVSQLPSGLYLYSLTNSRGRIMATKRLFVGGNN